MPISRRNFVLGLTAALAGCTTNYSADRTHYGPKPDEIHPLPGMTLDKIPEELRRQEVAYATSEPVGTIIVDTPARRLYLVEPEGKAMRYAISVGREGHELRGNAVIGRKAEWPNWTPTANMIRRDPGKNLKYAGGVPGGLNNPLGARAMYLYRGGHDINFRIHGTNHPESIGYAMSSGCIRMLNHDVIDLYSRVNVGDRVVVMQP